MTTSAVDDEGGSAADGALQPQTASEETIRYLVVVNAEEQYSIWPAAQPIPTGWRPEGRSGSRAECLDHIATIWTDMRPASLR